MNSEKLKIMVERTMILCYDVIAMNRRESGS